MYLILWEFIVPEATRAEFEKVYGPGGEWSRLFGRMKGYLGTDLLQDDEAPERFVSVDRWASAEAYRQFRQENAAEYSALDHRCEGLTEYETFLGSFERQ